MIIDPLYSCLCDAYFDWDLGFDPLADVGKQFDYGEENVHKDFASVINYVQHRYGLWSDVLHSMFVSILCNNYFQALPFQRVKWTEDDTERYVGWMLFVTGKIPKDAYEFGPEIGGELFFE